MEAVSQKVIKSAHSYHFYLSEKLLQPLHLNLVNYAVNYVFDSKT